LVSGFNLSKAFNYTQKALQIGDHFCLNTDPALLSNIWEKLAIAYGSHLKNKFDQILAEDILEVS
jgi:hypothetical protein